MTTRRSAAVAALVLGAAALVLAAVTAVQEFPRGPIVFGCVIAALAAGWYGVLRRGPARVLGLAAGGVLLAVAVALLVARDPLETVAIVLLVGAALAAARAAFRVHVELSRAAPPRRPVLLFNPRSGGGKAARFDLPREARARGIEPVELRPGDDLERLARDAVARGADALAMAGGDGSQAVVAAVAAEHGLPYACVPAGTRNHFALDLGVDRDDVVGALDALVDGGERVVDLAEVNGRVFVNNVSLGLYAEAVQRTGYREAKLRTLLDAVPDALGPGAPGLGLSWDGPDGAAQHGDAAILVSNDRYRLGRAVGSGTRPRLDAGVLGVTVVEAPASRAARPWREWTAAAFDVHSDRPVAAGVDGEAVQLAPPLRFRARPAALRVRIARAHPGASPSALQPEGMWEGVRALARLAAGREPRPLPGR